MLALQIEIEMLVNYAAKKARGVGFASLDQLSSSKSSANSIDKSVKITRDHDRFMLYSCPRPKTRTLM
jgi:hypothetical protein